MTATPELFKCLADPWRLRILNLLRGGPLCVCHLMTLLGGDQVKISKHLGYLRQRGCVSALRQAQWMTYRLPEQPHPLLLPLLDNLASLGEDSESATNGQLEPIFRDDLARREALLRAMSLPERDRLATAEGCCSQVRPPPSAARRQPRRSRIFANDFAQANTQ